MATWLSRLVPPNRRSKHSERSATSSQSSGGKRYSPVIATVDAFDNTDTTGRDPSEGLEFFSSSANCTCPDFSALQYALDIGFAIHDAFVAFISLSVRQLYISSPLDICINSIFESRYRADVGQCRSVRTVLEHTLRSRSKSFQESFRLAISSARQPWRPEQQQGESRLYHATNDEYPQFSMRESRTVLEPQRSDAPRFLQIQLNSKTERTLKRPVEQRPTEYSGHCVVPGGTAYPVRVNTLFARRAVLFERCAGSCIRWNQPSSE